MILAKTIREQLWKSVACAALLELHLVIAVVYFPDFQENVDAIRRMVPFDAYKKTIDAVASRGFDAYVSLQHFFKAASTFGTFAAVFFAMGAVAGEVERRTIEVLVSRPVSRTRILATKYLVGAVGLVVPLALTSFSAIPLAGLVDEPITLRHVALQTVHCSLFLLAFYSLTFALSAWMSDAPRVAFLVLGIALVEFALTVVKTAARFSIYRLTDMNVLLEILKDRGLPWPIDLGLAAASAAFFGIALYRFQRRDF